MPEGPEIRRAADQVAAAIANRIATEVRFGLPHLKRFEKRLSGQKIKRVESRGKAMLIRFANGLNIYSHNQLYGRWVTVPAYEVPDSRRQLRLAIHNRKQSALLYSASDIDVITDAKLGQHPFLKKLGPDLLGERPSHKQLMERLQQPKFKRRQLGSLLTDQSFVAGLGNYLRCEILFVTGLSAKRKAMELDGKKLAELANAILALPRQSYETGGITNDLQRARGLLDEGASFEQARFYVFRRAGKPCYHCGEIIQKLNGSGQALYYCPRCQA
jgi:endonuclease-8